MTPPPRKRVLRLTPRDTQIFEDLLNRRADTLGGLHARHFAGRARETARNRLGALAAWGYLERCSIPHMPDPLAHPGDATGLWTSAYTLTPKGVAALRRRSIAGSTLRGRSIKTDIDDPAIPHQLAVNRIGEILGATLTADHLLDSSAHRRHRPDAAYPSTPDTSGRATVMLEIDLGHYSRQRILGKLRAFLADPDAKAVLFACPTDQRAAWIARAIRDAHGDHAMNRIQVLTFHQITQARLLRDELRPAPAPDPAAQRAD